MVGDSMLDLSAIASAMPLANLIPKTMIGLLECGAAGFEMVKRVIDRVESASSDERSQWSLSGSLKPAESVAILAPVPAPRLIFSSGLSYAQHEIEMAGRREPHDRKPDGSFRCSSSVIGHRAAIRLPRDNPDMVDTEVEFSIVIGKPCHRVPVSEAMDYVAGYTLYNDVSARDWNKSRDTDLIRLGKQFPTFGPLGPYLVTQDEVPDPHNVDVRSTINGKELQNSNTRHLIFTIAEIISYLSKWYLFQPGDIITTGSPAGVGFARDPQVFLRPGDVVTVEAPGIGVLENTVLGSCGTLQ